MLGAPCCVSVCQYSTFFPLFLRHSNQCLSLCPLALMLNSTPPEDEREREREREREKERERQREREVQLTDKDNQVER